MNRPWFTEDNKVDFVADGLRCALRRGPLGSWCGYVAIPKSHPWYGKSYQDTIKPTTEMLAGRDKNDHGPIDLLCAILSPDDPSEALSISLCVRVHGGLTYADNHEPFGKPGDYWWFGFDCAHYGDLIPAMSERHSHPGQIYRTQTYVVAECQSLAAQLAKVTAHD